MCSPELVNTLEHPTRCLPLSECQPGDWEDARFVYEWRKREGTQHYQPLLIGALMGLQWLRSAPGA